MEPTAAGADSWSRQQRQTGLRLQKVPKFPVSKAHNRKSGKGEAYVHH